MNRAAFILLLTIPACMPAPGVVTADVQEEVVIVVESPKGTKKNLPVAPGKTYHYTDADHEQKLTISHADKDLKSLTFKLETTSESCHFRMTGDAVLKPVKTENEVDEDNQGNAYEVREYLAEAENFSLVIRLAYDEEDVRIRYKSSGTRKGACAPLSDVLMVPE